MSFVNGSEIFSAARKGHYAVGAFNTNNLEWTRAILKGAQEKNVPVLIQVSMGAAKYMGGYKLVRDLVASEMEAMNITVPVVMHLDHGNYEAAKECIEAGFSSVMFDGHDLPFEENLAKTKEIVELAHAKGISVEAEVGSIGGEEDGVVGAGELADVEEAKQIAALGVDYLACGIGNAKSHLLKQHVSTSKKARIKKVKVTTLVNFLHLVHKLSQIQLKKSSIGSVHQKLNNLKIKKDSRDFPRVFFRCDHVYSCIVIGVHRSFCRSQH